MRNGWTAEWFGGRQKHCLTAESLKGQLPKGLTARRLAGTFVDTDPTVEVGTIVEMNPVAKYPEELSIRGREPLQSRVRVAELLLREGAGRRMPMRTLHVAIGGSIVARRRCTGRSRSSVARSDQSSNGPSNHPSRISRGTTRGIRVGVGDGWGHRRENGGRDECPGTSIDAGTAGTPCRGWPPRPLPFPRF